MDDEEENDTAVTGKIIRSYLNKDEKEIVLSKYFYFYFKSYCMSKK